MPILLGILMLLLIALDQLQPFPYGPTQVCPKARRYGKGPSKKCIAGPVDPNLKPRVRLEKWFTRKMWEDLFPVANQGWGEHPCLPYSYDSFVIAARYFPQFGGALHSKSLANSPYTLHELQRRDVAAFFAHVLAESGLNNLRVYKYPCKSSDGSVANDGNASTFEGCYFGRGPLQLSWNYNYGQFQHFLRTENIEADLLNKPNLLVNRLDPPLAMLSALWFYMTPQPPKPSMHEIIMGNWVPSERNRLAGYNGSVFGPTSLVINHECNGEDPRTRDTFFPGKGGENRRIKAFKWFCQKLSANAGPDKTLSCKGMPEGFDTVQRPLSWQPDWANMWRAKPCDCTPAPYAGILPFFDPKRHFGRHWAKENERNRLRCVYAIYKKPDLHRMDFNNSPCLQHPVKIKLTRFGLE